MKKINKRICFFFIMALFLTSCDKWIDTDINIDKDRPTVVPMQFLVPSIQVSMAYDLGGNDAVRISNIWMQYFDGTDRQSLAQAAYLILPSDPDNLWNSVYASEMMDAHTLIKQAGEQTSPVYAGVGKICMAWCLGEMTNFFGAMPYTECFQGNSKLTPAFDKQSAIYATINRLLTEAITDLSAPTNTFALKGDLVYGNSAAKWIKAAHSLLARTELNLSKVSGDAQYAKALAHVANGFASNADDFQLFFGKEVPNHNPIYQFMDERGDIVMASTFMNILNTTNDPRTPFYATKGSAKDFHGSIPGKQDSKAALPGEYNAGPDAAVVMMSFSELKFIEAEAKLKTSDAPGALIAYKAAVAASVLKVTGSENQDWLDANINTETAATLTLKKIIGQKYLALYSQNQPYTDLRRTGFPDFLVTPQGATKTLPRRFPYPQSEVTYNTANIPAGGDASGILWIDGGQDVGSK